MPPMTLNDAIRLALQHHGAGHLPQAESIYRQVIAIMPNHADATHLLGVLKGQQGDSSAGIELIRRAISLSPNEPGYHSNLGNLLNQTGEFDEAITSCQRAVGLKPDFADAHNNLGNAYNGKGLCDQAIASLTRAIELRPDCPESHNALGSAWKHKKQLDQAIACYKRALQLRPGYAEVYNNLGDAWDDKANLDEAISCFQRAIQLNPQLDRAHFNLGNALNQKGCHDQAVASFRRAMQLKPRDTEAHDRLLLTLLLHPGSDAQSRFQAAQEWNQQHAQPLKSSIRPHANSRDPQRRLRVGYVSPDFWNHPVGRFTLPLLAAHDHERFEIFCYALTPSSDALTQQLRAHADTWRSLVGISDDAAAQIIRQDQIDILVDLAMHASGNRILIFARKPAPVQVTYLACAGGTGVDAIDYRFSDRYLDPEESSDRFYLEKCFRLPGTYCCYQQSHATPEVSTLPAISNNHITFACLNNFSKINAGVLGLWCELLRSLPDSRLLLLCPQGAHRDQFWRYLRDRGIAAERVELFARLSPPDYFQLYQRADIALDPFPCVGGTTTCDTLWMGLPVVTLAGQSAVGRAGVSILSNLGHPEWVAQTPQEYLRIARDLAADRSRLSDLRQTLRQQMQSSPLMDSKQFARDIESAYRIMWRTWCDSAESPLSRGANNCYKRCP